MAKHKIKERTSTRSVIAPTDSAENYFDVVRPEYRFLESVTLLKYFVSNIGNKIAPLDKSFPHAMILGKTETVLILLYIIRDFLHRVLINSAVFQKQI